MQCLQYYRCQRRHLKLRETQVDIYASVSVPGCTASRGEDSYFTTSHWFYCAFDSDHYHDGFIVPEIWQTKSRKWLGVTQGDLERHVVERVRENCVCECVTRTGEGEGRGQIWIHCMIKILDRAGCLNLKLYADFWEVRSKCFFSVSVLTV